MTIGPVLTKNLPPYDPINDLTPVTLAVEFPIYLVVRQSILARQQHR